MTRVPIACSLTSTEVPAQLAAWESLRPAFARAAEIDGGLRLWFDRSVEDELRQVAAREAECCAFLALAVDVDDEDDLVRLDLTSDQAEARPVIDGLAELAGLHG